MAISIVCIVVVFVVNLLFFGKNRVDIETITVSNDEAYIAFFETGKGHKIRCFQADGTQIFEFQITPDISAGGFCTLWFEKSELCAYFYRTDKIVHLNLEGQILEVIDRTTEEIPEQFSLFRKNGHRYTYDGSKIDVIYERANFWSYWFLGEKRYIAIINIEGKNNIVYAWSA